MNESNDPGVLPVVGDAATVYWGLHLNVGDEVTYMDAAGRPFAVRIVGIVENWIFQGALVADRDALSMRFPDNGGDGLLVVERAENSAAAGVALHRQLADHGVVLQQPTHILEGFMRVEKTFMLIFGALGGLGMLLAVAGVVVLSVRRLVESAADVAVFRALGFAPRDVRRVFLTEILLLMSLGTGCGGFATLVALSPRILAWEWGVIFDVIGLLSVIGVMGCCCLGALAVVIRRTGTPRLLSRDS